VSYKLHLSDPRIEHSRRVICRAALKEFAEAGYSGFRMESVAARAGVGRSTVYRHWPNKAALIADALETLNTQPDPDRELVDGTARQRVEVILNHLAEVLGDSPLSACVPALVHAAETEPAVRDFHHTYSARRRQRLTDTIAAGVEAGRRLHRAPRRDCARCVTHSARSLCAASSSSRACARPLSDSPNPASMRASSATRSSLSRRRTPLDLFRPPLSTTRWTSA
jgi:TetR/AcrR family transcriptional regulator of autoinduction and epiphytic fitness